METVAHGLLGVACLLVLAECAVFARNVSHLRTLGSFRPPEPARWPRVSVIIAGRDEADTLAGAVASRLADDYPDLEVVFVDDRSSDGTGAVLTSLSAQDPRLRVITVDALPDGWLGKVNAMQRGLEAATGEWLLFSDADVHVARGTMRTVIAHALEERVDMVALVPEYRTGSFTMDAIWASFMRALALAVDPRAVADPGKRTVIGSGAFNLVARSAYDRTPGMAHLRLETGDDVALAAMVKEHGGRVEMLNGRGHASVAVYRNVREFLRGVEKNGSSLAQRPLPLLISAFALLLVIEYAPIAVVVLGLLGKAPSWLLLIGALATAASTAVSMTSLWVNTRTWLAGLAWPFGLAMMVVGILRSVVLAHRRGGIIWRGTFYPLEEISAGQRFTL